MKPHTCQLSSRASLRRPANLSKWCSSEGRCLLDLFPQPALVFLLKENQTITLDSHVALVNAPFGYEVAFDVEAEPPGETLVVRVNDVVLLQVPILVDAEDMLKGFFLAQYHA